MESTERGGTILLTVIMLSILKDRKNGDISCPKVWRLICLLK